MDNRHIPLDNRPTIFSLLDKERKILCSLCNEKYSYYSGVFSKHLKIMHNMTIQEYYNKIFGEKWQYCVCGCLEKTSWQPRNGFWQLYSKAGHRFRGKTKETDIAVALRTEKANKTEGMRRTQFKPGIVPWNTGLTKDTNEILKQVSIQSIECHRVSPFRGKTKENCEILRLRSENAKKQWQLGLRISYFSSLSKEEAEKCRLKALESLIRNNKGKTNRCFKNGTYKSNKNNLEWVYQSSWELDRMKQYDFDQEVKNWFRSKDIIKYVSKTGKTKFYNPDFEIELISGEKIIEEVKGYKDEDIFEKMSAAKEFYDMQNKKFRIITKFKSIFKIVEVEELKQVFGEKV